jgi:hypothetical protein
VTKFFFFPPEESNQGSDPAFLYSRRGRVYFLSPEDSEGAPLRSPAHSDPPGRKLRLPVALAEPFLIPDASDGKILSSHEYIKNIKTVAWGVYD